MPFHDSSDLRSVFNRLNPQFKVDPLVLEPPVEHWLCREQSVSPCKLLCTSAESPLLSDCSLARSVYGSTGSAFLHNYLGFLRQCTEASYVILDKSLLPFGYSLVSP